MSDPRATDPARRRDLGKIWAIMRNSLQSRSLNYRSFAGRPQAVNDNEAAHPRSVIHRLLTWQLRADLQIVWARH